MQTKSRLKSEASSTPPPPEENGYLTIAAGHAPRNVVAHLEPQLAGCRLFVRRLRVDARLGVYEWEKAELQPLLVDLEFEPVSMLACHTDRLDDTVDYAAVVARLRRLVTDRHFELVENLANEIALMLHREFGILSLRLVLSKLAPFPGSEVGIAFERSWQN
jgi:dihydroneopterin aldolase